MEKTHSAKYNVEINQRKKEKEYWKNKFGTEFIKTTIPYDNLNSNIVGRDKYLNIILPGDISNRVRDLGKNSDPRILVILTSCLAVLLSELNQNKEQVIIGMPIYKDSDIISTINTIIPVILNINESEKFKDLLNTAKNTIKEGIENYAYPINLIPEIIGCQDERTPFFTIFDVAVTFNGIQDKRYLQDINYNVHFEFSNLPDNIEVAIEYNSSLYSEHTIKLIGEIYVRIVNELLNDVNKKKSALEIIHPSQKEKLLVDFNSTRIDFEKETSIHEYFIKQAQKTPDKVALVFNDTNITYRVLNEKSDLLCKILLSKGVKKNTLIGLISDRNLDLFIGILGILKSGAGYLAIDIYSPKDRIRYMIKDSGVNIVIGNTNYFSLVEDDVVKFDFNEINDELVHYNYVPVFAQDNIAYVLYTSGTTGFPKGIVTEHKNVVAYCNAFLHDFNFKSNDIILQQASYSFDTFIEEVFPMLFSGGMIVIADSEMVMDVPRLAKYILKNTISIIDCSPLLINELGKIFSSDCNIQTIISGGDVLKGEYLEGFSDQCLFYNTYGPTESTICATYHRCSRQTIGDVPIGKPISNYKVLILNQNLKLVPIGYKGEICISGAGIAKGYLNNVELTNDKFITNPFNTAEKLYKSGDIGKLNHEGIISFCGRADNQVSIRGYRIELGEIENQILRYPGISDSVVVPIEKDNEKWICAYFISEKPIPIKNIQEFLSNKLPNYMLPSFIKRISKIPTNFNGKISVRALPDPFDSVIGLIDFIDNDTIALAKENIHKTYKKQNNVIQTEFFEISDDEKNKLLFEFNNSYYDFDKQKHIIELFEDQVKKTPDRIAIVFNDTNFSYAQLDRCAHSLAFKLIDIGIKTNSIVGLLTQRSINMIIGILGVLKSGGAFMPLEEEAPDDRLAYIISNTTPELIIVDEKNSAKDLTTTKVLNLSRFDFSIDLDKKILVERSSNDLTHVLHTSGTTGRPKGVLIENRSIINLFNYVANLLNLDEKANVLSLTPVTFDVFSSETLLPLVKGAKVIIMDTGISLDIEQIIRVIQNENISFLQSSPTGLKKLIPGDSNNYLERVKNIISAGEPLLHSVKEKFSNTYKGNLYNLYGPTETTLYSTGKDVTGDNSLNIGYPVYNTEIRILDSQENLVPMGKEGEIFIAGEGVSRGYINQPELTFDVFRIIDNKRFYKTGDLAKWLPDGEIDFLGRLDNQVQLGGVRVEPGEIENIIISYPGIDEVAVVVREDEENIKYLMACLVASERINESEIRGFLTESLTLYLIPRRFIKLESMQYTSSRKIHRKLLELIDISQVSCRNINKPKTDIEKSLTEIWSEVLNISQEEISVTANFFAIGGHSLKASSCINKLKKYFDVNISLIEIFKNPTIIQLAAFIQMNESKKIIEDDNLVLLKEGDVNATNIFLIHDAGGEVDGYIEFCKQANDRINYWGIRAGSLKKYEPVNITVEQLANRYIKCLKKVQKHGEYNIAGWSLGGTIAFEMVRQLEQEKKKVRFLGIIDSMPPSINEDIKVKEFSVESELSWIRNYFDDVEIITGFNIKINLDDFWFNVINYLKNVDGASEIIKGEIMKNIGFDIKEYQKVSIEELVKYMNFTRSLGRACNYYIPGNVINSQINYFAAGCSKSRIIVAWQGFSSKNMIVKEVEGNHFSIFTQPNVKSLYKKFFECFISRENMVLFEN